MKLSVGRGLLFAAAGVAVFIASFTGGYRGFVTRLGMLMGLSESTARLPVAAGAQSPDSQIVLIYIGSSTCLPSNDRRLREAWHIIKDGIEAHAGASGRTVVTLGVARDYYAREGLRHLRKYGAFDEVTSGQGWSNLGVARYVWRDLPGLAATPQILVIERVFGLEAGLPLRGDYTERVLMRKVGLPEIIQFAALGAPIPVLDTSGRSGAAPDGSVPRR